MIFRPINYPYYVFTTEAKLDTRGSSLNVFDDGAVILLFKFWTFSIVSLFLNHNVSRDGSSLVLTDRG
jgi:hypothetical protein